MSRQSQSAEKERIGDRSYIVWEGDTASAFTPSDVLGDYVEGIECACGVTCDPRDPDHVGHRATRPEGMGDR